MTARQLNQKYSARHLTLIEQALDRKSVAILSHQLTTLKAVNRSDGYPYAATRRHQEDGLTFWRIAHGNKIMGVH